MVAKVEGRAFVAHPPPREATDKVQMNWNARQWQELQARLAILEKRLAALEPPVTSTGATI